MTINYVKQISENIIKKIIKKVYPDFEINYIQYYTVPTCPTRKALVTEIKNSNDERLTIFFSDFDCEFVSNTKFKYDEKKLNKFKMLYLKEMVKTFSGTNYIFELENEYNKKLEWDYKLLKENEENEENDAIKKAMKKAVKEIKYLKNYAKNENLEK